MIEYIEKAIVINPNAHFGREIYQKRLVEYVISKRTDERVPIPLAGDRDGDFATYLQEQTGQTSTSGWEEEKASAIKGILGMMRFGDFKSSVLLEVLGDLLSDGRHDAGRLAARAYLKASYECDSEEAKEAYRRKANDALSLQIGAGGIPNELTVDDVESALQRELLEADTWFNRIRSDELNWIKAGLNPEVEYSRKYYGHSNAEVLRWIAASIALLFLVTLLCRYLYKRRMTPRSSQTLRPGR